MKLILLIILFLISAAAIAHDGDRHDLDGWFKSLQNKNNVPCCDGSDALHLRDVDTETQNKPRSHYRVRIPKRQGGLEMIWIDVPDDAVIETPNKDGSTIVWPVYSFPAATPYVRCFIPGALT